MELCRGAVSWSCVVELCRGVVELCRGVVSWSCVEMLHSSVLELIFRDVLKQYCGVVFRSRAVKQCCGAIRIWVKSQATDA